MEVLEPPEERPQPVESNENVADSAPIQPEMEAFDPPEERPQPVESDGTITDLEPDSTQDKNSGWRVGRRVVELGHLADQLVCRYCSKTLSLKNIERERRYGYASMLYIPCECGILNTISTGKSHRDPSKKAKGTPIYDINTKAVLGKNITSKT